MKKTPFKTFCAWVIFSILMAIIAFVALGFLVLAIFNFPTVIIFATVFVCGTAALIAFFWAWDYLFKK